MAEQLISNDIVYNKYMTVTSNDETIPAIQCPNGTSVKFLVHPKLRLLHGPDGARVAPEGVTLDALMTRTGPFAEIDKWAAVEDMAHLLISHYGIFWCIVGIWRDGHRFCFSAPQGLSDSWPPRWTGEVVDDVVFAFGPPGAFVEELDTLAAHNFVHECYETYIDTAIALYVPPPDGHTYTSWRAHLDTIPRFDQDIPENSEEERAWALDKIRRGVELNWTGTGWEWRRLSENNPNSSDGLFLSNSCF